MLKWLSVPCVVLLVALSYVYVDRPVAFWVDAENLQRFPVFAYFTYIPVALIGLGAIYYVLFVLLSHRRRRCEKQWQFDPLLAITNSVAIAVFMKSSTKFVFGRTWPATWVNNNPSLLNDGVYGFNPFHGGDSYASFPSGHACVGFAAMTAMWLLYPRLRILAAFIATLVVLGLLANNYHFVSDCIAGAWLGALIACQVCARRPTAPSSSSDQAPRGHSTEPDTYGAGYLRGRVPVHWYLTDGAARLARLARKIR